LKSIGIENWNENLIEKPSDSSIVSQSETSSQIGIETAIESESSSWNDSSRHSATQIVT
jgi:hypothetical protein